MLPITKIYLSSKCCALTSLKFYHPRQLLNIQINRYLCCRPVNLDDILQNIINIKSIGIYFRVL